MSRSLIKDSYIYGLGAVLSRSFGFVLIPLYTRYLSVAEYGALALLNQIVQLTSFVCLMGISSAAMRFYFEPDSAPGYRKILYGTATRLLIFFPPMVLCMLMPLAWLLMTSFVPSLPFFPYVFTVLLIGLFVPMISLLYGLLRVQRRPKTFVTFNISFFLFQTLSIIVAVAWMGYGLKGQVYSQLFANAVFAGAALVILQRFSRAGFSRDLIRRMLRFGIPLVPFFIFLWVNNSAGRFFLESFVDLEQVGIFALAVQFSGLLILITSVLDSVLLPHFLEMAGKDRGPNELGLLILRYIALAGLLGVITIVAAAPAIRILSATPFHEAIQYVGPLMLANWIFVVGKPIFWSLNHSNKTGLLSIIRGLSAGLLVILLFIFLGRGFAIMGVIYAMLGANVLAVIVGYAIAQRFYQLAFDWPRLLAITALLLSGGAIIHYVTPDGLYFLPFVGQVALFCALSAAVFRLAGISNPMVLIRPGSG